MGLLGSSEVAAMGVEKRDEFEVKGCEVEREEKTFLVMVRMN